MIMKLTIHNQRRIKQFVMVIYDDSKGGKTYYANFKMYQFQYVFNKTEQIVFSKRKVEKLKNNSSHELKNSTSTIQHRFL